MCIKISGKPQHKRGTTSHVTNWSSLCDRALQEGVDREDLNSDIEANAHHERHATVHSSPWLIQDLPPGLLTHVVELPIPGFYLHLGEQIFLSFTSSMQSISLKNHLQQQFNASYTMLTFSAYNAFGIINMTIFCGDLKLVRLANHNSMPPLWFHD